jgi:hypothetical protein
MVKRESKHGHEPVKYIAVAILIWIACCQKGKRLKGRNSKCCRISLNA